VQTYGEDDPFDGLYFLVLSHEGRPVAMPVSRSQRRYFNFVRDSYLNGFWGDPQSPTAIAQAVNAEIYFLRHGWQDPVL
jgi:hypothetical protein